MKEESVNRFINNRYCLLMMGLMAAVLSYFFHVSGIGHAPGGAGIWNTGIAGCSLWAVNALTVLAVAVMMRVLDKNFAFVREYTVIYAAYFLFSSLCNPSYSVGFPRAAAVNAVLMVCVWVLFGGYQQKGRRSFVFLISFVLSLCSLFDYSFLFYIPVFILGFMQMKIFSFKGLLAILLGLAVPYWIACGSGMLAFDDLRFPRLVISKEKYLTEIGLSGLYRIILAVVVGSVLGSINLFKLMNYRMQLRSYNGFFTVLALLSIIFIVVDATNFATYLMSLNICVAYQVAHFLTTRKMRRGYILFFFLILANAACAVPELIGFFKS